MDTVTLASKEGKWVMAAAITASAMGFIDAVALNVAIPSIQRSLHTSATDIFWILNAYLLMLAALILVGGSLGDKLGRKKMLATGIMVFATGSLLCGLSATTPQMIAFRVIQGAGGAFMIPGSLAIISSSIRQDQRGKAIGIWSSITTLVTLGAPILGGVLADAGLWRWIFFINIPIGLVSLLITVYQIKEVKDETSGKAVDVAGAVAIAVGLAALTFGFLRIPAVGFRHVQVYASLAGGALLLIAFFYIEARSKHPMMPLTLFANKAFSGTNLLTFFLYAGLTACMLFLSLNLVQIQGYSQFAAGMAYLPFTILLSLAGTYAGKLADKYGPRLFLSLGPATAGAGMVMLAFAGAGNGARDYWVQFFPGIVTLGAGMAFTVAPLTATVMGAVDDHLAGTASGVNNALSRIAGVFANAVFGALAVLLFSGSIARQLDGAAFSVKEKTEVMRQAKNLGNAVVPGALSDAQKTQVTVYYRTGFLIAYKEVMLLSAGLCFVAAMMTLLTVPVKRK